MLQAGTDVNQVAGAFGVQRTTIERLRDKFANTGSVKDRPKAWSANKGNCTGLKITIALHIECFKIVKSQESATEIRFLLNIFCPL